MSLDVVLRYTGLPTGQCHRGCNSRHFNIFLNITDIQSVPKKTLQYRTGESFHSILLFFHFFVNLKLHEKHHHFYCNIFTL